MNGRRPGTNPNIPQILHAVAEVGSLRNVVDQLKQGVDSLAGFRGDQLGRAVTFQDLIDIGVIDRAIATSPAGSATPPDGGQYDPPDPTGTAATTPGVMMGLKATFAPRRTGALFIAISGTIQNNTAARSTVLRMRIGAGPAPNNGDASTGQAAASDQVHKADAANSPKGFCTQAIVFGLTVGTTYWIDLDMYVATPGTTGVIKSLSVSVVEL